MSDWQTVRFGSLLAEPVRNGIYKKKEFHGRGAKMVNMGELFACSRLIDVPMKRVDLNDKELSRFSLQKGDLIFARRSLTAEGAGKCAIVAEVLEPTAFESSIIRARPEPSLASSDFLYYYFASPAGHHSLDTIRRQVAVAGITGSDLSNLEFRVPDLQIQREIASVLSVLDDKIELNRRMNETLEDQARALFRDWFVDFGPVKAKMAGDTPYLAPDLWSLFPDRLNDEGLPEGWKRSTLGEVLNVLETGKRPRGGVKGIEGGTPSVGAESIAGIGVFDFTKTKFVPNEFAAQMNKGKVDDRDVLVYKDGGKPGELRPAVTFVSCGFPFSECVINEHVFRVRSGKISQEALYCILTTEDAFWQMKERATGVAQPGLNQEAMRSIEFVDPRDDAIWKAIHSLVSPLFELCNRNALNSKSLAQTRDLLLPKLMSGEIRVGGMASEELSAA